MKQKDDDKRSEQPEAAAPKLRKRFRLEKLEERIAPTVAHAPYLLSGAGGGSIASSHHSGSSVNTSSSGSSGSFY